MKKLLKTVTLAIMTATLLLGTSGVAFAGETQEEKGIYQEYIRFKNSFTDMASDGSFNFEIRWSVKSDMFTAKSNTLTVQTRARLFDAYSGSYSSGGDYRFRMTLYKSNGSQVGSYVGYTDNIYGGLQFKVEKGQKYYIILSAVDSLPANCYVKGSGKVEPVSL